MTTLTAPETFSDMIDSSSTEMKLALAKFFAKGGKVTRCGPRHAASAAPREHTGGLDRYQFRAYVRFSKGA